MQADFILQEQQHILTITVSGNWKDTPDSAMPSQKLREQGLKALQSASVNQLLLTAPHLESWNSLLLAALYAILSTAAEQKIPANLSALPEGLSPMLKMALAVPPHSQNQTRESENLLELVGSKCMALPGIALNVLEFLGEITQSLSRFFTGKASFSPRDLWTVFRECGVDALPIVTLTSMLLGLILAFVSSMQLKLFGAEVYVASLVGVSMVRVMGPVLTGIVLAGRTGASFAAIIGSMQVNEEVDALTGFGISPMDFLVLPRVLGLALMTPLLALYADVAGIAGGFLVGVLMLDISPSAYLDNTLSFMSMTYVWIGLLHALVFGLLISLCGCYQGIRCGRNASAVGRATTSAVVNSIVGIIVATSVITIIFTVIDL
jgi:phospholipid/cholesterol/gamma-HCH transport system permease protein